MNALEADRLTIGHGAREVAREVSMHVRAGDVVAVLGASGAGKSTLLRTLAGDVAPMSGRVRVGGKPPRFPHVVLVDQFPERQFFASTVYEEVAFARRCAGDVTPARAVRRALDGVGLVSESLEPRSPWTLSVGEQRRVALASQLVAEPDVLLLDEPTASLDEAGRSAVADTIVGFAARGGAVLAAGHDRRWVLPLAARAFVVAGGRVVERSPADVLREQPADPGHSDCGMYPFVSARVPDFWTSGAWRQNPAVPGGLIDRLAQSASRRRH